MKSSTTLSILIASLVSSVLVGCEGTDIKILTATQSLESSLVDPGSVKYKDVRRYADGTVCGQYNAKNSMGGYTGFEPFIYWKNGLVTRSNVADNIINLCSDDGNKVEVIEKHLSVDFNYSKKAAKKSASVGVFLYVDANDPLIMLNKRDAIEKIIKQVFEGSEMDEVAGDKLNTALLNALLSDKELASVQRVSYVVM